MKNEMKRVTSGGSHDREIASTCGGATSGGHVSCLKEKLLQWVLSRCGPLCQEIPNEMLRKQWQGDRQTHRQTNERKRRERGLDEAVENKRGTDGEGKERKRHTRSRRRNEVREKQEEARDGS